MTCEDEYFWYYEINQHYIAKTNTSAAALGNFNPNDNTIRGLTWDGTHIRTINASGTINAYSKSGMLGQSITDLLSSGWGLCYDGTFLWVSDPETDKIYQISLSDDETPPEPPLITSQTHPVSTVWYSDPNPTLSWSPPADPSGINGYSFLIDALIETEPDSTIDGTDTTTAFSLLSDGPWYFHCRARDGAGNWSDASHFRILIDTTPPGPGTIVIDNNADTTSSVLVTLTNLTAADFASGMGDGAAMRFSNDIVSWSEEEPFAAERPDWDLTLHGGNDLSGTKRVYVAFMDAAGNWSEAFSDDIAYNAPLSITTDSLAAGTVGITYAETLSATGGWPPYQWDLKDGVLPPGLILTDNGFISGDPESEGDFTFTVRVTDNNMYTHSLEFNISISIVAVKGDVNGDVVIDILDLVLVVRYILHEEEFTPTQIWTADVQPDGVINVLDALGIVNTILGMPMAKTMSFPGDAIVWIKSEDEDCSYSIVLDSPVPVAGVQLSIKLPQGSTLKSPPTSQSLTLSYKEEKGVLRVVLYTLTGTPLLANGSQSLLTIDLSDATGPIGIESITVADEDGEPIPASVKTDKTISPAGYVLHQNYPNPFNPETDIRYQIPAPSRGRNGIGDSGYPTHMTLKVYNLIGQEVRTLVDETKSPGQYTVTWDGRDKAGTLVPSGVYFCKMKTGETTQAIKMILSK